MPVMINYAKRDLLVVTGEFHPTAHLVRAVNGTKKPVDRNKLTVCQLNLADFKGVNSDVLTLYTALLV